MNTRVFYCNNDYYGDKNLHFTTCKNLISYIFLINKIIIFVFCKLFVYFLTDIFEVMCKLNAKMAVYSPAVPLVQNQQKFVSLHLIFNPPQRYSLTSTISNNYFYRKSTCKLRHTVIANFV